MLDTYQHLQLGSEPDVSDFHLEMVNKFQTHMEKILEETKFVLTQAKDNEINLISGDDPFNCNLLK